jgi:hypothetical protein
MMKTLRTMMRKRIWMKMIEEKDQPQESYCFFEVLYFRFTLLILSIWMRDGN